ncbi:NlpC/P60 family peptidoglycan-binding protein RipD [Mycobacterium sp. NPDC050041]|jgi:cell wall-associated NlpC family hydrolase|uniref:NlpC/P60 family peptidoglycan-binding protein RipD n=1 Tax=Mycobacterium sp. NPDC050041 TaxID=3364293 RepID=UPI003C2E2C47
MRRFYAVVIGVAMLLVTAGHASAEPYTRSTAHQQAIDYVIARALAQRGVPFVYGGGDATGPTSKAARKDADPAVLAFDPTANVAGFDASGLMLYAFSGVGVKIPRSSGDQFLAAAKVAPAQALPGDLLFYGPNGTQSVALYLGNGQMLEATDPAVAVTPVRTANMMPYLGRFIA